MRLIVKGDTPTNNWCRMWVGTRANYTAANLPNGSPAIITDEAEVDFDLGLVYPVGSIYMNATDDTNPGTLFGIGTWSLIDSKFLYGCNSLMSDLEDTGGATSVTLTQNNLPASLTNMTISSLTGSTSTESTDHMHTTVERTNLNTGIVTQSDSGGSWQHNHEGHTDDVTGSTATWSHTHSNAVAGEGQTSIWSTTGKSVTAYTQPVNTGLIADMSGDVSTAYGHSHTIAKTDLQHTHPIFMQNLQHNHKLTIPALTTGNQSEHATHQHTVTTTDLQTVVLRDVGSGTAFSILPSYQKVAIWYRVN